MLIELLLSEVYMSTIVLTKLLLLEVTFALLIFFPTLVSIFSYK